VKVGDLVKMKPEMWWKDRKKFTKDIGIIYSIAGQGIKILMPDNSIKLSLQGHWTAVEENNESR